MATSLGSFIIAHPIQLAITALLVIYSLLRQKLTPLGVLAAAATALIHILHPSPIAFSLLVTFFLAGTIATRINHARKATLTQSSTAGAGGEGARNASQVFANTASASMLILIHLFAPRSLSFSQVTTGIIGNYAAASADTLASELGILSPSSPFLITRPWQRVPRGTNGGVTPAGLFASLFGSTLIAFVSYLQLPTANLRYLIALSLLGLAGSVLDSVLGAVAQMTVRDRTSGKVIEGANGRRVLVKEGGSRVRMGRDVLNNNGVNFVMAACIAVASVALVGDWI